MGKGSWAKDFRTVWCGSLRRAIAARWIVTARPSAVDGDQTQRSPLVACGGKEKDQPDCPDPLDGIALAIASGVHDPPTSLGERLGSRGCKQAARGFGEPGGETANVMFHVKHHVLRLRGGLPR